MTTSSHGLRSRSRNLLKKRAREKGMPSLGRFLEEFKVGDKVVIKIEPSELKGMPDIKFNGKCAEVAEKRGGAYLVKFKDKDKEKSAICSPIHLRRFKQ